MSREDFDRLTAQGIDVETVGDILGTQPIEPFFPPRLPDAEPFPEPGIYFDMPEERYHAIHAASTSGLKNLSVSSMQYWWDSPLNPEKEEDDAKHLQTGKLYHKRIVEGREAFEAAYAVQLDQSSIKGVLVSSDEIKKAIREFDQKPTTRGFDDNSRTAVKRDWIDQLLALNPDALIWDKLVSDHAEANEGKAIITAQAHKRVEIAAKMIEAHPELGGIFHKGHAEVSLFWFCPVSGAPMKARLDYLKLRTIVDLKSFANKGGIPVDGAIEKAIASYRYVLQQVIYDEGVQEIKRLIRTQGQDVIHGSEDQARWATTWSNVIEPPAFLFVFQQTGNAPVTRGLRMPRGMTFDITKRAAENLKFKWIECARIFGVDPWLDIKPIEDLDDEAIPTWATEF